jgi:hypothetical protein
MNWFIYNKMLVPIKAPHIEPYLDNIHKILASSKAILARYTTNFDCGYQTQWWYVIKDDKMDLAKVKSKYRGEILKGINGTSVIIIDKNNYYDEMFGIFKDVMRERSQHSKKDLSLIFSESLNQYDKIIDVWGVFINGCDKLVAYAIIDNYEDYVNYREFFFNKAFHKYHISNALVYFLNRYYLNEKQKKYVCDGERSINHPTNIQDYLIRTFGFRKAYCELKIIYRNKFIQFTVNTLYFFKPIIYKLKNFSILNRNLFSLIKQEEIQRSFK